VSAGRRPLDHESIHAAICLARERRRERVS
jgi:hypothetical protein